jgi:tetratricopeptide (TPR) repeat protein
MWRNDPKIRFEGMIHETVSEAINKMGFRVAESPVPILHFAYLKPGAGRIELMQKAAREEPQRSNNHYFLGEEYIRRGEFKKATDCFINALACNMVRRNDPSFAVPVQQMLDITKAVLEKKDISSFPENVRQHFGFLTGVI